MRPSARSYAAAVGGTLARWVLVCITFGVVFALVDRRPFEIRRGVQWIGERLGAQTSFSGVTRSHPTPDPFQGAGIVNTVMNWVYWRAPAAIGIGLGWLAAAVVRMLLHRWLPAWGVARDGRTRCGRCGYHLSGLSKPVCPECGLVI